MIAPVWTVEHQKQYGYSAHEHAAVLNSLRDACRRFSIDTDRVFLSGHSMGGDAAWDIGLAHPDLWAGVIPIVAQADRYCALYWENARYVPFYVVAGELDGAKLTKNARDLDRYLRRGFDATVVEYLGRGHEDFYDEILRIFDWMGRFRRNFFPREFACETMRPWDNYFWWVEVQGLPPRSTVDPADWPPPRGTQPVQVKASINNTQRHQRPHRHQPGDGVALAEDGRLQAAFDDHGQRPAAEQPRSDDSARPARDSGGRPHPRRPPASVLGPRRRRHREETGRR